MEYWKEINRKTGVPGAFWLCFPGDGTPPYWIVGATKEHYQEASAGLTYYRTQITKNNDGYWRWEQVFEAPQVDGL